ncbi:MAG: hypothetical protein HS104_00925 [Polyangiaceae bacterium]|nr:hypothetical protein [Polyangiaceae bacterium]MCL4752664.1 hypothetical protein [Myxococcales bacterium]
MRLLGPCLVMFVFGSACGGQSSSDGTGGAAGASGGAPGGGGTSASGGSGAIAGTGGAGAVAGTGATAGSGGMGASAGAGGLSGGAIGECNTDADCEMVASCCDCVAGKKGTTVGPPCDLALCESDMCTVLGVKEARCIAGQCSIAASCDQKQVFCNALPPTCAVGLTPSVVSGCWGPCIPHQECSEVESCFVCPKETICVVNDAWGSSHHCVNPAPGCSSGCGCLKSLVCIGGYSECGEFDDGSAAHCSCPTC